MHEFGAPQTWNRYTYALNNPLRLTDPSGMGPESPVVSEQDDPHKILRPKPVAVDDSQIDTAPVQIGMKPIPTASGPMVPDDGTKPPPMIPMDSALNFAEKALGLPTCQWLFHASGTNGQTHLQGLRRAGRVRVADESVMVQLPDGSKVRLIDTTYGGTVQDGVIYVNPNNASVNGTDPAYGQPGIPTQAQMIGGLVVHEELHETGDFPAEMGFTLQEVLKQSGNNDTTVHVMCVQPAMRRFK